LVVGLIVYISVAAVTAAYGFALTAGLFVWFVRIPNCGSQPAGDDGLIADQNFADASDQKIAASLHSTAPTEKRARIKSQAGR
jgi:hypothetical protein